MLKDDPFFAVPHLTMTGDSDPLRYYSHPVVGFLFRKRIRMGLSLLPGPYDSLLEIGYGCGFLLPYWKSIARKVSGLDLDAQPAEVLQNLGKLGEANYELVKGSILNPPYADQTFDCVVAFSILEHIAEIDEALRQIRRVCRAGATVLVGMPAVHKVMEIGFRSIGYSGIENHHVTTPQEVLRASWKYFELEERRTLPFNLPVALGMYHAFRLRALPVARALQ